MAEEMPTPSRALSQRRTRTTTITKVPTDNVAEKCMKKTRANWKPKEAALRPMTAPGNEDDEYPDQVTQSVPILSPPRSKPHTILYSCRLHEE